MLLFCVIENIAYFADCPYSVEYLRIEDDERSPRPNLAPMLWKKDRHTKVVKVYFETDAYKPENAYTTTMSINSGSHPWLLPLDWKKTKDVIMAGTPLNDFIILIRQSGGRVYLPSDLDQLVYQEIVAAGKEKDQ